MKAVLEGKSLKRRKKPHSELSDRRCRDCGRPLKANLADRKAEGRPLYCFKHWRERQQRRNHTMTTAREVRQGRPGRKVKERRA